ncbi:MAG: hypothetical protein ACO3UU_06790 [Minisyncoccia bacterium]
MAKDKVKISSNEVDRSAPLYANPGDPKSETIDPRELRYSGLVSKPKFSFGNLVGSGEDEREPEEPEDPISKYIPKLSDITIVSETFDYSTTPVTIKLKLKITDSTGQVVTGIKARVPK